MKTSSNYNSGDILEDFQSNETYKVVGKYYNAEQLNKALSKFALVFQNIEDFKKNANYPVFLITNFSPQKPLAWIIPHDHEYFTKVEKI